MSYIKRQRQEFVCVACGHNFYARKTEGTGSGRQCSQCFSYDVLTVDAYNRILTKAQRMNPIGNGLGLLPNIRGLFDVLINVFNEEGVRFRPASTLNMTFRLLEIVEKSLINKSVTFSKMKKKKPRSTKTEIAVKGLERGHS